MHGPNQWHIYLTLNLRSPNFLVTYRRTELSVEWHICCPRKTLHWSWHKSESSLWLVGEDIWTPNTPGDVMRNMCDPFAYSNYDYCPTKYQGSDDYGGFCWNSGIANLTACIPDRQRQFSLISNLVINSNVNVYMQGYPIKFHIW